MAVGTEEARAGKLNTEGWSEMDLLIRQIAANMGINVKTLWEWKKKYPPICNALKTGKEVADIIVENALFEKAKG